MELGDVIKYIVTPAMAVLPATMDSIRSRVLLLGIGGQESEFLFQVQQGGGPAHSYWQMEQGGGVRGVLRHPLSMPYTRVACHARNVAWNPAAVWAAMATDEVLACIMARLLLFTDPAPLPDVGDQITSWMYYKRNWRPGKPRPLDWPTNHQKALEAVCPQINSPL